MSQQGATPEERAELDREDAEERELLRPPDVNQDSNRSATRLELFFDLAFVLFVARSADVLAKNETWTGGLEFAAILAVGWWAWASATLYANRFDTDDAVFRLLTLAGMAAVIGMAASVDKIGSAQSGWFAAAYVLLRVVLIAGYLRAWRHLPDARRTILPYLLGHSAGAAVWAVSIVTPEPWRYVLWGVGVAVDLVGPTLAARLKDGIPLHMEHLPERFGLFVILVLGESVAGIAHGLHDAKWVASAIPVALLSFVLAAGLWWSYFDLAGARAKRLLNEVGGERSDRRHDVYIFGQLPLTLALATVGAGIELAVVQSGEGEVPAGTRLLLAGGVAVYLVSMALTDSGMSRGKRRGWWWPLGAAALAALDAVLELPAVVVVGGLAALMVAVVVVGTAERSTGRLDVDPM